MTMKMLGAQNRLELQDQNICTQPKNIFNVLKVN